MLITIWDRWNQQEGKWESNHIEDGWTNASVPTPKTKEHEKAWKGGKWWKTEGYLVGKTEPRRVYTKSEMYKLLGVR